LSKRRICIRESPAVHIQGNKERLGGEKRGVNINKFSGRYAFARRQQLKTAPFSGLNRDGRDEFFEKGKPRFG